MSNQGDIKADVLKKIHEGSVRMRPRVYFVAQVLGLALLSLAALVVTIFLLNFILFSIRLNRQDLLLAEGPGGWAAFIWFFPWGWFALDALLVWALERLLRMFRWGWRTPALYMVGGLVVFALGVGLVLDRATPLNDDLFEMRHELPLLVGSFYEGARHHDIDDTLQSFGIPLPPDGD